MSLPLTPFERWLSGTNQNSIPANNNSLRAEIFNTDGIADDVTAQPGSPADGDWYIIPSGATGTQWATFAEDSVAIFYGGTWYEFVPQSGNVVTVAGDFYIYGGSSGWEVVTIPVSADADDVSYDNTTSGLSATNVQDAIDEVRRISQNSKSAAYTLVLTDAGKHILHPSADTTARTFTIPANASVAFPIGTAVTFVNQNAAGVLTIAITSDTMRLAGAGTTGSRTLAANGMATALKITSTEWIISGTGLT